ncbi:MAG TPA: Xaa-Pro peptidase family protein [Candidatus Dormibacteraeota bacterium]|nr:Xaa-Pro peptidase family protein [Candidatus Dormibacteraeota bacterium]
MAPTAPFDTIRLDALLDEVGADVAIATSPHNVRYLVGSYSDFHAHFDAIGIDRYLPALLWRRASPDDATLVGAPADAWKHEVEPPWVPTVLDASQSAAETARLLADRLRTLGLAHATVAIEQSFAPYRFLRELTAALPGLAIVEAAPVFEELRAIKRPDELELLREAAERIVDAMADTAAAGAGLSTREIADRLRLEEESRGLRFEYCLIAAGDSFNRAPSPQPWRRGEVLSLDSGGNLRGYIGDLCRMAVREPPPSRLVELLAEVRAVQDAARRPVRPGIPGGEVYAAAEAAMGGLPHGEHMQFVAHGMGLVPHEAPRLSATAPIRYPATHRDRPLQPGMVLSIETDLRLAGVGLVKLEDTVVVTASGCEGYGDAHRDWIVVDG